MRPTQTNSNSSKRGRYIAPYEAFRLRAGPRMQVIVDPAGETHGFHCHSPRLQPCFHEAVQVKMCAGKRSPERQILKTGRTGETGACQNRRANDLRNGANHNRYMSPQISPFALNGSPWRSLHFSKSRGLFFSCSNADATISARGISGIPQQKNMSIRHGAR